MGLFERFRGKETGGDGVEKTSGTQAELKEMMAAKSELIDLAAKIPVGFGRSIVLLEDDVVMPEHSTGEVRVEKKLDGVDGHNADTGQSTQEEVPKTKIMFATQKVEPAINGGTNTVDINVVYTIDRDGLRDSKDELITDMTSPIVKTIRVVLEKSLEELRPN